MKQSRTRSPRPRAVPTQHNDPGRTGHNSHVHGLDWATVTSDRFGKLFDLAVDGFVFAQPLFVPGVPTTERGSCDLLIVATMRNVVYAFDANANGAGGALVWARKIGSLPAVPSNAFGLRYNDMYHAEVGIVSTPVVDLKTLRLYLVAMSFDARLFDETPEDAFAHHLYALDLRDGSDCGLMPKRFEGEVEGKGYLAPNSIGTARTQGDAIVFDNAIPVDWIAATASPTSDSDVQTTRLWAIRDGKFIDGEPFVVFNSMMQLQRPGLLLHDGCVFSAFGSHGDADPYHGWVFAHDAETLEQAGIFCTTANGTRAGIWQAGEGLVADRQGYLYAGTGNGDTNIALGNYGECLLKLKHDKKNGLKLHGVANVFEDKIGGDDDFGASSPTLLDDDRMIGGGKDGNFFLFDPPTMLKNNTSRSLAQIFLASYDSKTFFNEQATHHIHGSPIVFKSLSTTLVYVWGENDYLRCYRYDDNAHYFPGQPNERDMPGLPLALGGVRASADRLTRKAMPGGFLSISSAGARPRTGIVWASFPSYGDANQFLTRGELRAFKADDFQQGRVISLWSSRCHRQRDDFGIFAKFAVPTVAGDRVYQPTCNNPGTIAVYGVLEQPDGGYDYDICGRHGLRLDGAAYITGGVVHLTEVGFAAQGFADFKDAANRRRSPHASTCFLGRAIRLPRLSTSFDMRIIDYPDRQTEDAVAPLDTEGFTFCIAADLPEVVGGSDSGFGYGPDAYSKADRGTRIERSCAVAFGLTNDTLCVRVDGRTPQAQDEVQQVGLTMRSGHLFRVNVLVGASHLDVEITDLDAPGRRSFRAELTADVGAIVGASGFIGLTAATGKQSYAFRLEAWR